MPHSVCIENALLGNQYTQRNVEPPLYDVVRSSSCSQPRSFAQYEQLIPLRYSAEARRQKLPLRREEDESEVSPDG